MVHGLDRSHPGYAEFRKAMLADVESTPSRVLELRREITELCAPYHAMTVVAACWSSFGITRADTLRSYVPDGPSITAEYVAHVLLDRPDPAPLREPTPEERQRGPDVRKLGDLVGEIFSRLPMWFSYKQSGKHEHDAYLELRTRLYMQRMVTRSFTFEWDERATLAQLFDPFEAELRAALGFSCAEALSLSGAIGRVPLTRLETVGEQARHGAAAMKAKVAARRADGGEISSDSEDRIEQLAALRPEKAERWIDYAAITWMGAFMGQTMAFDAAELAGAADVNETAAVRFLDAFAVEFGQRADAHDWDTDPEGQVGLEMEVMRARPVVADGEGKYFPAAVDSVFYGLRDVFTDALKTDEKAWKRFDRHRGRVLEQRAVNALARALDADWSHAGLNYTYEEDGETKQGEADGVLRIDNAVVLVEAKAGSLAPSARRAAPARLERGLRDLIVAAHEQLRRADEILLTGRATRIWGADGKNVALDLDGVSRVVPIAVTLEDLSPVASAVWQLQATGLLPAEAETPWTVGIHELELICELTESRAQLVHYILRRRRAYRQRISGIDEMDFWMRYLSHKLWWDDEEVAERITELTNHTDPLDAWAYGERGLREKAPRPRQKLSAATRRLLDALEESQGASRLEAALMLLEMDDSAAKRLATGLKRVADMTQRDGRMHDETLIFGDDMGVTVHAAPVDEAGEAMSELLATYGQAKAEEHGLRRWAGLSTVPRATGRIYSLAVIVESERLRAE